MHACIYDKPERCYSKRRPYEAKIPAYRNVINVIPTKVIKFQAQNDLLLFPVS
jgi:hypothetical protein